MGVYDDLRERFKRGKIGLAPHMPYIRSVAELCETATEFGVKWGCSTSSLLTGVEKSLRSYDIQVWGRDQDTWNQLRVEAKRAGKEWTYIVQNVLDLDALPETDIVLDDALHSYEFFRSWTGRYEPQVRNWIIIHDTEFFDHKGQRAYGPGEKEKKAKGRDPESQRGLKDAIEDFIQDHPEWGIVRHTKDSFGLTTLARDGAPDHPDHLSRGEKTFDLYGMADNGSG